MCISTYPQTQAYMHGIHSHDIMPMKDIHSLTNTGTHTGILPHVHRWTDSTSHPKRQWTNMTHRGELPNVYTHTHNQTWPHKHFHTQSHVSVLTHKTPRCAHACQWDDVFIYRHSNTHRHIHTTGHVCLWPYSHTHRYVHHSFLYAHNQTWRHKCTYKTHSHNHNKICTPCTFPHVHTPLWEAMQTKEHSFILIFSERLAHKGSFTHTRKNSHIFSHTCTSAQEELIILFTHTLKHT